MFSSPSYLNLVCLKFIRELGKRLRIWPLSVGDSEDINGTVRRLAVKFGCSPWTWGCGGGKGGLKQEDCQFAASISYIMNLLCRGQKMKRLSGSDDARL